MRAEDDDLLLARVALLAWLKRAGYQFVTVTPATHERVLKRTPHKLARTLRDVFGWSRPFSPDLLPPDLLAIARRSQAFRSSDDRLVPTVRVSSLDGELFLHSAFPTNDEDAVFFGPDTYRFARYLKRQLGQDAKPGLLADIGAGSGAGGLVAAKLCKPFSVLLTDTNPKALDLARANAMAAGLQVECRLADGLDGVEQPADLIIANPPFIAGDGEAAYKDGGDMHGARISLDWALAAVDRMAPGGRLLMYTGVAILDGGHDPFREALLDRLPKAVSLDYEEIDPDIFGEQLAAPAYRDVERITAIGFTIRRPV